MLSLFSGGEGTASLPHREAAQPVSGDKERDPGPLSPGPALSLRPGCPETPPLRVAQRALSYPEPSITVIKPCIEDFSLMSNSGALRGAPASVETPRSRLLQLQGNVTLYVLLLQQPQLHHTQGCRSKVSAGRVSEGQAKARKAV